MLSAQSRFGVVDDQTHSLVRTSSYHIHLCFAIEFDHGIDSVAVTKVTNVGSIFNGTILASSRSNTREISPAIQLASVTLKRLTHNYSKCYVVARYADRGNVINSNEDVATQVFAPLSC